MSLLSFIMAATTSFSSGQSEWTTPGTYSFVVPAGVYRLSGVVIAPGSHAIGGGNHWRNTIPVFPGETLTVEVGKSDRLLPGNPNRSSLKRGSTYLLRAEDNLSYYPTLGGGGGNGGTGGFASAGAGGGGAGGYVGSGGNGGNPGGQPAANSGGGVGGDPNTDGGGAGLQGRTADFAPGSRGTPKCGGGIGEGQSGGDGGVRLIWGPNRSYPDAAVDV